MLAIQKNNFVQSISTTSYLKAGITLFYDAICIGCYEIENDEFSSDPHEYVDAFEKAFTRRGLSASIKKIGSTDIRRHRDEWYYYPIFIIEGIDYVCVRDQDNILEFESKEDFRLKQDDLWNKQYRAEF